jgi:hypothetical protein
MGLGGKDEQFLTSFGSYLTAIDYKTGKIAWRHKYPGGRSGGNGLLTTAGKLLAAIPAGIWCLRSRERQDPMALTYRKRVERPADVHAGRASVYAGRRRRYPVRVHAVLTVG